MNKILSFLKYLIGWPLSLVSLFFIAKLIYENASSLNNLKNINFPLLLIGVLLFITYFFLRGFLWRELIKNKDNKFDFLKTIYFWQLSEIKRYTPGNIWSFLSRTQIFSQDNIPKKEIASSLLNEVILIVLASFSVSFFYLSSEFKNSNLTFLLLLLNIALIVIYSLNKKINIKIIPKLKFHDNLKIYMIAMLTFFSFGLATYFSAASIIYLDPKNILSLVSLFVFALLVGYLSIVTPMGLGVREGVVTFGLLKYTSLGNAGLISIFTRIIFIISEVIFFVIIWSFEKLKNTYLLTFLKIINKYKYEVALLIFVLIYFLYFTSASFLRYDNFFAGRFDLGNMDQTVWNTIHGRIFQMTDPNAIETVLRLNFHSDFILVLISPLYIIWSNPKMLLLLQTIVLGAGALFVFVIVREVLKEKSLALTFSVLFLLNPSVQFTNLYDFHAIALGTTLLLATFYFFIKKSYLMFLFFAFLAGITKEEIWIIVSLFGLAVILRVFFENRLRFKFSKKQFIEIFIGAFLLITSAIIFYLLIWFIMPALRGDAHFALSYYSGFGESPLEVSKNVILMPTKTISIIFSPQRIDYLVQLFLPFGFISLLSPLYLVFATPDLLINLLSSNKPLREIYYQYTSAITPFILISAVYAVSFLKKRFSKIENGLIIFYLLLATFVSAFFYGPLPGGKHANIQMLNNQLANRETIEDFISKIPESYSVTASNNLGSHLSHRRNLYNIPIATGSADMVLFLLNDYWAQPPLSVQKKMAEDLKNNKNYTLVFKDGDFVAFAKKSLKPYD